MAGRAENFAAVPRIARLRKLVSPIGSQAGQSQSGKPVETGAITQARRAAGITCQGKPVKR
jgi:hypothetical protein